MAAHCVGVLGVLSLGHAAHAAPRPPLQLSVTAAGELAYFAGEVERALADDLRHAGVVVAITAVDNALPVQVALEGRPGDRVVIAARVRGHQVDVEGAVESLDALVAELATRVLPLSSEATVVETRRGDPARPPPRARPVAGERGPLELASPTQAPPTQVPPTQAPPTQAPPTQAPPTQAPPTTAQSSTQASPSTTASVQSVAPPAPVAQPPVRTEPASQTSSPSGVPADPYGPDARVAETPMERPTFIHGRVVVHTLADPPDAPAGTGAIATQALYATLQRQLRQSIVPLGVGVSPLSQVADEGIRAQARFVVMGRLDSFAMYNGPTGAIARLRIELSVVREGRYVVRRALYAETPMNAVGNAIADGKRGRQIDPVYLAVVHALDGEIGELSLAFGADGAR